MPNAGTVVNTSNVKVSVLFDGIQHEFEPGESKNFIPGVAREILNSDSRLSLASEVAEEEPKQPEPVKVEVAEEASEPEVKPKRKSRKK